MAMLRIILQKAAAYLSNSDSPRLDAEILLTYVLQKNRSFLYSHPDFNLSAQQLEKLQNLIQKRHLGWPIAYLINEKEFWSLALKVSPETLIPRPETELLVEHTLANLKDKKNVNILDLGTGSGNIAIACAFERPNWNIIATDISKKALNIAAQNAKKFNLLNIKFIHSDWFKKIPLNIKFHAIISNPPYIDSKDPHLNQGDLRFEPKKALISGNNGLDALQSIIKYSFNYLIDGGILLIEHGFQQKTAVRSMLNDYKYAEIGCIKDYQGHDRVSMGIKLADQGNF